MLNLVSYPQIEGASKQAAEENIPELIERKWREAREEEIMR
jgi:hypothetical protein